MVYYYAGLTAFRRTMNQQQLALRTRVPISGSFDLRQSSSDSTLFSESLSALNQDVSDDDLDNPIPYNTSFSNPPTPRGSGGRSRHFLDEEEDDDNSPTPESSDVESYYSSSPDYSTQSSSTPSSDDDEEEEVVTDVGLGLLNTWLVDDDPVARTMAPFTHQRAVVLGHQVLKIATRMPTMVSPKTITNLSHPIQSISREVGSDGEMIKKVRQDWPCIFAPVMRPASPPPVRYSSLVLKPDALEPFEYRSHAVVNPAGTVACFRPLTFCSVHKNAGYLKLEDVERSENYTRVASTHPFAKVTHRFNSCVLEFPPREKLILFKDDGKDLMSPDENHHHKQKTSITSAKPDIPKPAPYKKKFASQYEAGSSSSSEPKYPPKYCDECRKCIDKLDWYLYRELVFCSEDCRYFHTLDSVLARNDGTYPSNPIGGNGSRGIVINEGGSFGGPNYNNGGSTSRGPNNGGNARGIVINEGGSSSNGGGTGRGRGNARGIIINEGGSSSSGGGTGRGRGSGNARGIVIGGGDTGTGGGANARAFGRGGYQNQNPNQGNRLNQPSSSSSSSSSSGKDDKGKGVLYIG